jgi:hypothetical protein
VEWCGRYRAAQIAAELVGIAALVGDHVVGPRVGMPSAEAKYPDGGHDLLETHDVVDLPAGELEGQ